MKVNDIYVAISIGKTERKTSLLNDCNYLELTSDTFFITCNMMSCQLHLGIAFFIEIYNKSEMKIKTIQAESM